jgi:hypothetical protein
MPYKSKAEQKSELWMTLPEAVQHIRTTEHVDVRSARGELLKALKDDAFSLRGIDLVRWKSTFEISGRKRPAKLAPLPDIPPRGQEWSQAKIRWASGKVLDPHGALKNEKWVPTWRVVWLSRSKVMQLWPGARRTAGSSPTNVIEQRRTGPKTNRKRSMINTMKADILEKRLTIDQLRVMRDDDLQSKYGDKVGAKRSSCREARDQVLTEFDRINSVK